MEAKKFKLSHTSGEWELIQKKISLLGKKDLNSYLRSKIPQLNKKFETCPESISNTCGDTIEKQIFIDEFQYESLKRHSLIANKPIARIIDEYLLIPLLEYEAAIAI